MRRLARPLAGVWAVAALALALRGADPPPSFTKDGYLKAGFELLSSFDFKAPNPDGGPAPPAAIEAALAQIPERIRRLDGVRVRVTGYMLPLKLDGDRTTEFLLVSSPMICCYGAVPAMNNWIVVRMAAGGTPILMDSPVQFYGRLHVGKVMEEGVLGGIFLLDGERPGDGQD
jgi:hypothetical protein